jgi:UrcA family protein
MKRSIFFAIAAATMTLALAAPAAADMAPQPSKAVSYAEFDLSSTHDADLMLARIRDAAREVCDVQGGMSAMDEFYVERICRRQTIANAVAALNNPMVTERYAMNGRTRTIRLASR